MEKGHKYHRPIWKPDCNAIYEFYAKTYKYNKIYINETCSKRGKKVELFPVRSLVQIYFLNKLLHLEILYTDTKVRNLDNVFFTLLYTSSFFLYKK